MHININWYLLDLLCTRCTDFSGLLKSGCQYFQNFLISPALKSASPHIKVMLNFGGTVSFKVQILFSFLHILSIYSSPSYLCAKYAIL